LLWDFSLTEPAMTPVSMTPVSMTPAITGLR
jgi:hypothetical protein